MADSRGSSSSSSPGESGESSDGRTSHSRKFDEEHRLEIDVEQQSDSSGPGSPSQSILNAPKTLGERFLLRSRSKFPLLSHYVWKFAMYIRGPQPKRDLPGP